MGNAPEQTPGEGSLIRTARKARGLSAKEAAARTPIRLGESRWYHIEAGRESTSLRVIAPPDTLAHMARVVGVTAQQLDDVGRADAAAVLREIERQAQAEAAAPQPERPKYADPGLQAIWVIPHLTEMERQMAIVAVKAWRQESDRNDETPQQRHRGVAG